MTFFSGFETGDLSEWDSYNKTPTVHADYKRSGVYGMKALSSNVMADGDYVTKNTVFPKFKFSFAFNIRTVFDTMGDHLTILDDLTGGIVQVNLNRDATKFYVDCYSTMGSAASFADVSFLEWHFLSFEGGVGVPSKWTLDGVVKYSDPIQFSSTAIEVGCIWGGLYPSGSATVWFDDITIQEFNPSLIARVESVTVKEVELKGVQTAHWRDSDPWVQIAIPAGSMLHQHLKPNVVEGTITCCDVTTIWEAFYTSGIINEATGEKTKFSTDGSEFVITLKDIKGNDFVFNFYDVRITTIDLSNPELESGGEAFWTIRFTAKKVVKA